MTRFSAIPVLLLLFSSVLAAQQAGLDESKLKASFEGKVVTLHHFCKADALNFDAEGVHKGNCNEGPWTIYGRLGIEKVTLTDSKLKIGGVRLWVLYKGEPRVETLARTNEFVEITIERSKNADEKKKLYESFGKIFLLGNQSFEDDVPDFWKLVVGHHSDRLPLLKAEENDAKEEQAPAPPKAEVVRPVRIRVSQGVSEGILIHKVQPEYPKSALWTRISGTVVMNALISKTGDIEQIRLLMPVGAGLDEAAYDAVRQWRYKPYYLKGEPVEVDTQITINFLLSK